MKNLLRLKWTLLLTVALMSCSLQQIIEPQRYAVNKYTYKNPHSFCDYCHGTEEPKAGPDLFPQNTDSSLICLDCHEYEENHHPVNFVPPDPAALPFPLYKGEVQCRSCHEIHGGPTHEGTPKLLRGGPYADRRTICFKCHNKNRYDEIDPHIMLDNEGAVLEVNGKPVCLLCHAIKPDPAVDRTPDVRFKADVGFLCWRCHPPMPDPFFSKHFLVTPSQRTLDYMQGTEAQKMVILPLVPRGRITCSTCHNPHQKGVILHEAAAKGSGTKGRLRMSPMCYACHNM